MPSPILPICRTSRKARGGRPWPLRASCEDLVTRLELDRSYLIGAAMRTVGHEAPTTITIHPHHLLSLTSRVAGPTGPVNGRRTSRIRESRGRAAWARRRYQTPIGQHSRAEPDAAAAARAARTM